MTYKLLTIILLIFSYSLLIKDKYTYQPSTESLYSHPGLLPEGNSGIAARYPGDVGIGSDSAVIFADDFESYGGAADLTSKWNEAYHAPNIRIAKEPGNVFHGAQALEFTGPKTDSEVSNTVVKFVSPEQDSVFLRYYARLDSSFNVLGSSHNGCVLSSSYWSGEGRGPGIPADGYNKFLASYEAWRGTQAQPIPVNSTFTSTIRDSEAYGAITSFLQAMFYRLVKSLLTLGRGSLPVRMSYLNWDVGIATS